MRTYRGPVLPAVYGGCRPVLWQAAPVVASGTNQRRLTKSGLPDKNSAERKESTFLR